MADRETSCHGTCSIGSEIGEQERLSLKRRLSGHAALLPAVGLALLPKGACPVCVAAYTGV
jgi:hypothetical protein